ncbi:hypothetical protein [Chryseobacterium sp.]|uniref:hypothetical protein n=1 Tax=Chryseobacterium sp. TaxID=1871047 RepID=UPI00289778FD|nr:hypothetical protein [Chryseobacterium sp.]
MKITEKITITNEDNMELMARYPDNYFDLAIVNHVYQPKTKKEYFSEIFRVSKNQISNEKPKTRTNR